MSIRFLCVVTVAVACGSIRIQAASVILNEYNAVAPFSTLPLRDRHLGDVLGNGGDWFELVVVEDGLDLRNWQLDWTENRLAPGTNEVAQGEIYFSNDPLWSQLRAGTILTFIETSDGDGRGVDTSTDTSYDPDNGDWWINVSTRQEQARGNDGLVSTNSNAFIDGDFSVSNLDWTLEILNAAGTTVFGPTGEGSGWRAGINSSEVAILRGPGKRGAPLPDASAWQSIQPDDVLYGDAVSSTFGSANAEYEKGIWFPYQQFGMLRGDYPPGAGDFDHDGILSVKDIDALTSAILHNTNDLFFDVNLDGLVDVADHATWVVDLRQTWYGDADMDGEINASDLVSVFQPGQYEDDIELNSTWETGDWNADAEFTTADLVQMMRDGGFEKGQRPVPVPEPQGVPTIFFYVVVFVAASYRRPRTMATSD